MASFTQILREQLTSKATRSDVLRPLAWFVALLMAGIVAAAQVRAPEWLLAALLIIMAVAAGLYLFAFVFCLFVDRDALRSEKFVTDKLAIEKGVYGDDRLGVVIEIPGQTALPGPAKKPSDRQK